MTPQATYLRTVAALSTTSRQIEFQHPDSTGSRSKLTPSEIADVRKSGELLRVLAERYGVGIATIHRIRSSGRAR